MGGEAMKFYTVTGTRTLRAKCVSMGMGLLICDHWREPSQWPFFAVDNGCYAAFRKGQVWNPGPFLSILSKLRDRGLTPDFVVLPDLVSDPESLRLSLIWLPVIRTMYPGFPVYLAVQDGMDREKVRAAVKENGIEGLFVGGSMDWKLATMADWCAMAHELGIGCHVGRIGPADRIRMALDCGADSIDSTTWVQRPGALERCCGEFLEAFE